MIVNEVHSAINQPSPASGYVLVPRTGHYPDLARPVKQFPVLGSSHGLVSLTISAPFTLCNPWRLPSRVECPLCLAAAQMHLLCMLPIIGPASCQTTVAASFFSFSCLLLTEVAFPSQGFSLGLHVKTKARNEVSWGQVFGPFYTLSQSDSRK